LNDIGRNPLLGNRKKIAKFLMRTFTCRSTFLYVPMAGRCFHPHLCPNNQRHIVARDSETGDTARLPAQVAGQWGLIK
jgi:hypothetical protein